MSVFLTSIFNVGFILIPINGEKPLILDLDHIII